MNETATVVVVFCDLVDSTALMTAVGDDDADGIRRELFTKWRAAIERASGAVVKSAGDGFMAVFGSSAGNAVRAAESLRAVMSSVDSPRPLRMRIGIAAGEASHEDGDWFGTPVVEASRLCAAADPDEVLLSDTARKLIGSRGGYEFTAVGSLPLKGLAQRLPTYALGSQGRKRRTHSPKRWIAAAVAVALIAGGAVVAVAQSGNDDGAPGVPVVAKPSYPVRLKDRKCIPEESAGDSTVSCQTLEVPEDRDRPSGRTVQLAVVRAPATDAGASSVPAVLLDPAGQLAGDPRRAGATLIRLGVRGRGDSTPLLSCSELDASRAARFAMRWSEGSERFGADLGACFERLRGSGIDLSQYDQSDIADDVRDLAFALRLPSISLVASNDFTRAAHVVIRRYPGLLESVLMNDPQVPPTVSLSGIGGRHDQSLGLLAQRCAEAAACKTVLPGGLVAAVDALRTRFTTDPARVTVTGPDGPTQVLVDDGVLMTTLAVALGSAPGTVAAIPQVAATGDPTPIAAYFAASWPIFEAFSAAYFIESCAEAYQVSKPLLEAQAGALPRWRAIVAPGILDLCDQFDLHRVADLTTPPVSAVPVFVIRGALTPSGSREALSTFAAGLTHFSLLELPNESAILDATPPCAQTLSIAFLRDPQAQLDTKKCEAADPPLPFATS